MAGLFKTLVAMLSEAPSLKTHGVTVLFGEENISSDDAPLPLVTIVPVGGPWAAGPGYLEGQDSNVEMVWSSLETVVLYMSAASADPDAKPEDHADAVDELRTWVLQALQHQRNPGGLFYKPVQGAWVRMGDAVIRYGRSYQLNVTIEIGVADVPPNNTTITSVTVAAPAA